jgi:hypothetical protein
MAFTLNGLPDYDAMIYEVLHASMDHLIDLGARCNAHSDVLEANESDDENDQPSPIRVLKAQLQLNGAEDEVSEVQELIQVTSQLLITRHTRRVVYQPTEPTACPNCLGSPCQCSRQLPSDPGTQDHSGLPDQSGSAIPNGDTPADQVHEH